MDLTYLLSIFALWLSTAWVVFGCVKLSNRKGFQS